MNKKITFLLFSFLLVIVLTGCQGPRVNPGIQTTNFNTGTKGLSLEFLNQAPPETLFETTDFDVQLYAKNQGAFSLQDPYVAKIDLTYDGSKVTSLEDYEQDTALFSQLFSGFNQLTPQSKLLFLYGRSTDWPDGEQDYVSLARFKAKEIVGNFQSTTATFIAQVCYPYETHFVSEVCIDTDTQGVNQREEVCQQEDKSYSGGQGAPIAVTAVESQMIPRGVYVQPQFTIHIKHVGEGTVSFRNVADTSYDPLQCQEIERDNVNKISVTARLGGDELTCLPTEVILKDGEAKVQCQLTQDKILGVSSNYQTSLIVDVGYLYSESFRKDIVVEKSEGTSFEDLQNSPEGCFSWQVYDEKEKKCVSTCEFQATYVRDNYDPFKKLTTSMDLVVAPEIDSNYLWSQVGCIYKDTTTCKDNDQLCILQNDLCEPGSFCGLPKCLLSDTDPTISSATKVGTDQFTFFCTDKDDQGNLMRSCGCIDTAYYGFVDKSSECQTQAAYTEKSTGTLTNGGMRHTITGLDSEEYKGMYLCVMVKDTLNQTAIRSFAYPFTT
ncbi:MAG: hypothetical protein KC535_00680 [Nanoarchaeota archaeon]|nr:hypothetical protein [Nanoarchaeota archaeon]